MGEKIPFEGAGQEEENLHRSVQVPSKKIFDPKEELKKVLKFPKEERRQVLSKWKEEYVGQRIELASLQADLIKLARENPHATREQLIAILNQRSREHHFTEEQMELAKSAIELYAEKHGIIQAIRAEYPDDRELFNAVFGIYPGGKVKIDVGPVTLNFICSNSVDFARLYHFDENTLAVFFALVRRLFGNKTLGVSINSTPFLPELKGSIIAEDASMRTEKNGGDRTTHEEQHAFRRLLEEAARRIEIAKDINNAANDPVGREAEATEQEILLHCKENIEAQIEDELLAFLKGRASDREVLSRMEGYYIDKYLRIEKKILERDLSDAETRRASEPNAKEKSERVRQLISRVIETLNSPKFYTEIGEEVFSAAHAYGILNYRLGIPHEEIAALLAFEPLPKWIKLANRIVAQKEKG